jgi:hypothetical protein
MWIARTLIHVERNGKLVELFRGDPVPEADTWTDRVRLVCERVGKIEWVEDAPVAAPPVVLKPKRGRPPKSFSLEG